MSWSSNNDEGSPWGKNKNKEKASGGYNGSGKGSQCEQDDAVKGSTEVGGGGENCGPTGNQDLTNVQLNFFNDATSPMGGAIDPGDFSMGASIGSMGSQAAAAESAGQAGAVQN